MSDSTNPRFAIIGEVFCVGGETEGPLSTVMVDYFGPRFEVGDKVAVIRISSEPAPIGSPELLEELETLLNLQEGTQDGGKGITKEDWTRVRSAVAKFRGKESA